MGRPRSRRVRAAALLGWLEGFRTRPGLAWLLVAVNLGGVAFGFSYYGPQFGFTPAWLWPWVPDSPLSVGLFALSLALHQARRASALVDWLAFLANVKVGLWTAFALLWFEPHFGTFEGPANLNFWLLGLHLAMVAQAFVLATGLRPGRAGLAAALWLGLDVAMDYGLAPVEFGGCVGTKPFTVPCEDIALLAMVTAGLWLLALAAGLLVARHAGQAPPTVGTREPV